MMYSVSLLFHTSPVDEPNSHQSWEDRILLILADDEDQAKFKAEEEARKHEFVYESAAGRMLTVKLACVERVFLIDSELTNGCELFSRFLRDSEARSLLEPFADDEAS